jgi:hypothetical protein
MALSGTQSSRRPELRKNKIYGGQHVIPVEEYVAGFLRLEFKPKRIFILPDLEYDGLFSLLMEDDMLLARMLAKVKKKGKKFKNLIVF